MASAAIIPAELQRLVSYQDGLIRQIYVKVLARNRQLRRSRGVLRVNDTVNALTVAAHQRALAADPSAF
jgi:hypothetical protein